MLSLTESDLVLYRKEGNICEVSECSRFYLNQRAICATSLALLVLLKNFRHLERKNVLSCFLMHSKGVLAIKHITLDVEAADVFIENKGTKERNTPNLENF